MKLEGNGVKQSDEPIVHTVAQLKGRRLRMARALTGFSRQELYEKIGIATSTIDTWESGRVELTEKSSIRVCASLKQVGIYCSSEWLLTGEGSPPRIMDELERAMFSSSEIQISNQLETNIGSKNKKIPSFLNEDIKKELSFFLNIHKNSLFHIVDRDFLNYKYRIGDCVAGVDDGLQNLSGKVAIGVLEDGNTIFGRVVSSTGNECRFFMGNGNADKIVKVVGMAEVIWHRMVKRFN